MGYRQRMTLAFAVLSVAGVAALTLVFLAGTYGEFKDDRMRSVERMTQCLAGNLYWDMQAADPRRVDEALLRFADGVPAPVPPAVLVLDADGALYASTGPPAAASVPVTGDDGELASSLALIAASLTADAPTGILESASGFVTAARIERDGVVRGTVLVDYPLASLEAHFAALARTALLWSLLLLPVLLGLGWLLGRHLVRPIRHLIGCMQRVGAGDLDLDCRGRGLDGQDDIGRLARGFSDMLDGLREKRLMEEQLRHSERLIAVGQLAAAVAHEINNPLGGLLNAVSTFKQHGADPRVAAKTVDLLERGLRQIQATVSALLVQARVQSQPLARADLEDLRILLDGEIRARGLTLDWHCDLVNPVALPASAVRQVLINLLLNAIQVSPPEGRVALYCTPHAHHLELRVEDQGPGIPRERLEQLCQPFYSDTGGHGLGLWVTYQIISQLGGSLDVAPAAPGRSPPGSCLEVRLPFGSDPATAPVVSVRPLASEVAG